jgi:hypothetical protein
MYKPDTEPMMSKKVRKQIYILPEQEKQLKRVSESLGISEAEVIRQAIDTQMRAAPVHQNPSVWEDERAFIKTLIAQGPVEGKRTWTRERLYER